MSKRFNLLLLLAVWLLGAAGYAAEAKRVVSLSPALTETIAYLGCLDRLVGRSSACDYPATVKALPAVGDFAIPSLEKIVAVRPDLVVADTLKDAGQVKIFRDLGIDFQVLPLQSIADYKRAVGKLGDWLDCREAAAKEIERVEREVAAWAARRPEKPLKVLLLIWDNPPMTAGRNSFLTEYVALAGGRNIAEAEERDYFSCAPEWVLQQAPEVVLVPSPPDLAATRQLNLPGGWEALPAVAANRVYTDLDETVVNRLGPRLFEGIAAIHRALYPATPANGGE